MNREIENFVNACLKSMRARNWSKDDLVEHVSVGRTTLNSLLSTKRLVSQKSVRAIGEALGVQKSTIDAAVSVSRPWKSEPKKAQKKMTFSDIELRLKKSDNLFRLALKELAGIDEDVAKVLSDISERLRATSVLKNHLSIFEKH